MSRSLYSPSTLPVEPRPDPVLMFVQQALLSLVYRERIVRTSEGVAAITSFNLLSVNR